MRSATFANEELENSAAIIAAVEIVRQRKWAVYLEENHRATIGWHRRVSEVEDRKQADQ